MGFVDGLFADKHFIVESLISFIDEERQRIVEAGVVKKESCDRYLGGFFKKLADTTNNDEMISKLTSLYESMQNVKLQGDKFFEEESKTSQPNIIQEEPAQISQNKIADFLEQRLEKIAYSFGSSGNHRMAYEVEKTIQSIKRGE